MDFMQGRIDIESIQSIEVQGLQRDLYPPLEPQGLTHEQMKAYVEVTTRARIQDE